jgi:Spy/CpxP family protein refolding chaperone
MRFASWMLSGILIAGSVFAQQGPRRKVAGSEAFALQGLKNYLNLSDDQVSSLKTVEAQMRDALRPMIQELTTKTRALRDENQKPSPDAAVVNQLKEEIAGQRDQIRTQRADFQKQLQGILNADQLASLADLSQALRLLPVARAAAALDLIDSAGGAGVGRFGQRNSAGLRMLMQKRQGN